MHCRKGLGLTGFTMQKLKAWKLGPLGPQAKQSPLSKRCHLAAVSLQDRLRFCLLLSQRPLRTRFRHLLLLLELMLLPVLPQLPLPVLLSLQAVVAKAAKVRAKTTFLETTMRFLSRLKIFRIIGQTQKQGPSCQMNTNHRQRMWSMLQMRSFQLLRWSKFCRAWRRMFMMFLCYSQAWELLNETMCIYTHMNSALHSETPPHKNGAVCIYIIHMRRPHDLGC